MANSKFIMPIDYPDSIRQTKFKLPFATGLLLKDNYGEYLYNNPPALIETDDTNSCYHVNNIPKNLTLQGRSKIILKYTLNFKDFMNDNMVNKIIGDTKSICIVTSFLTYSEKNENRHFIILFSMPLNLFWVLSIL